MRNALFIYIICNDIFRTHPNLKNDVRCKHQSAVKIKFQMSCMAEVKKEADGTFKCTCGKGFKIPSSLQKYMRRCDNESIELYEEEVEAELIDISDSNTSESMDMDGRIIHIDCFSVLISHEKC